LFQIPSWNNVLSQEQQPVKNYYPAFEQLPAIKPLAGGYNGLTTRPATLKKNRN